MSNNVRCDMSQCKLRLLQRNPEDITSSTRIKLSLIKKEVKPQRQKSRKPQTPSPHEEEQLDIHEQKQLWESSGIHTRNKWNQKKKKNLEKNLTKREGKTASFCLRHFTSYASPAQSQEEIPRESFLHWQRESRLSNHLPQPFQAPSEGI